MYFLFLDCLRMMFKANKLAERDKRCSKVIAQRIQVSEIDMIIDPILQVYRLNTFFVCFKKFIIIYHIQISNYYFFELWQDACSLDLVKFCRNVPAREGKRLHCLFYILREEEQLEGGNKKVHPKDIHDHQNGVDTLQKECVDVLKQRSEMFK